MYYEMISTNTVIAKHKLDITLKQLLIYLFLNPEKNHMKKEQPLFLLYKWVN
jgi:hypothetical protein